MYDLVVVGCGVSSYAFLKGLENNSDFKDKEIAIICPSEYKNNTKEIDILDISPKFLQKKNLLSLAYFLQTFGNFMEKNFSHIGVHGIGGMARIWGGSIGVFNKETLEKNNFNYEEFVKYYDEIKDFLPYSGNEKDILNSYFLLPYSKSVKISRKIKELFGSYLNDRLKIGYPRLLVKENCNNCNQCLIGCENDSIWYPLEKDFSEIKNLKINMIKNRFVTKISNKNITYQDSEGKEKIIKTKYIILGGGVMQNYKLLSQLEGVKDKKANLYITPAVAFAFLNFSKNNDNEFFGMGNATFILEKNKMIKSFGNLYDGYSLALSKGLVFSNNKWIDKFYKVASKYMVAGAGFTSSDNAKCSLDYKDNKIIINGQYSKDYEKTIKSIIDSLKLFAKEKHSFLIHIKKVKLGADIHYAGGIPSQLFDKDLVMDGNLKEISNIKVIGGSTFSYLSPESPTLSYIANSYRIGKKLRNRI